MLARASLKRGRDDTFGVAGRAPPSSSHPATGMRHKMVARQPVTTVQSQILLAANVDRNECAKRKHQAALATELLAPLRTNPEDYDIKPGMFTMCHYDPYGGLGRTHQSNDTCLQATSTPAGLSVSARLCYPALATINTHPGNSQQTLRYFGVDSFTNTGHQPLFPGDQMLLDPVATMIPFGPNAELVSAVEPPKGTSKDWIPFNVRGMNPMRQQQDEQEILALVQRRMGSAKFKNEYTKAGVQGNYKALRTLISEQSKAVVDDNFHYAVDDPRRGFIELHMARFLTTLVMTSGAESIRKNGVAAKRCLVQVMMDLQRAYEDENMQWRACFPAWLTTAKDPFQQEAQGIKLETEKMTKFMHTAPTAWEDMAAMDALINHQFDFYARLQSWRIQDYFARFIVGSCLTHTMPGKLGDMIVGQKK